MQRVARGAAEILSSGGVAAGQDALGIANRHLPDRIDEELPRLGHRRFRGAVHGEDQLVGVLAHADSAHHLLGAGQRIRQRDFHLRIAEEAVGATELRHGGVGTLLQSGPEPGNRFLSRDPFQLAEREGRPQHDRRGERSENG